MGQIERRKVYMYVRLSAFELVREVLVVSGVGQIGGMWVKSRLGRWMTDGKQGMPLKLGESARHEMCGKSKRISHILLIVFLGYCCMYFSPSNHNLKSKWVLRQKPARFLLLFWKFHLSNNLNVFQFYFFIGFL